MKQRITMLVCLTIIGFSSPMFANDDVVTKQKNDIENFINYVWKTSPIIEETKAKLSAAESRQRAAAKWKHNPEISFDIEDMDGEDKTKILGISQTIDWSGKFISSGKIAAFELQAVREDHKQNLQNTAVNILSNLAEYKAAENIYNISVNRSLLMNKFVNLAGKRFKAGDIDKGEKNLAQLALSESLMAQADVENLLSETKQALNSSIGFQLEKEFLLPTLPNSLPKMPDNMNENSLLTSLPFLQAIKNREDALREVITTAKKNQLPDPTIAIAGGKDAGSNIIGLSISLPLNIFNTYGAEVDEVKAESIAIAKSGQYEFYNAKIRLNGAQRSYRLSQKAWENWQKNGKKALADQINILDRKFKVGDISATDYLVQIEQALDTQIAAEKLHAKVWKSWFAWLGASGTINQWIQNSGE